jgi:hypothetical protein
MAPPPRTASPASWKPAVPPPPVTGAAEGYGLYEGLGYGLYEGLGDGLAVGETLSEGLVLTLVLTLTETLALTEPLALGDRTETEDEGVLVPGDDVQAESATAASTVVPTAVSLTRCTVRTMAVRAFIEPPRVLGNDHFPAAGRQTGAGRKPGWPAFGC